MLSTKIEKFLKWIPATLAAIGLIIGFTTFAEPAHAYAPELTCDIPTVEITLNQGDVWDSLDTGINGTHAGPVYGFVANGSGSNCTWTAEVNNYHDTLSFDDEGGSNSIVLYETESPEDVRLDNECSQPLTIEYCPLY